MRCPYGARRARKFPVLKETKGLEQVYKPHRCLWCPYDSTGVRIPRVMNETKS